MDTLYLLRFHKGTPISQLNDEQQDLYTTIKGYERQIIDLDPLSAYSAVAKAMRMLATAKAKKSYIERLIHLWEVSQNRSNHELHPAAGSGQTTAKPCLFPPDYYGNYPS